MTITLSSINIKLNIAHNRMLIINIVKITSYSQNFNLIISGQNKVV